jgi:predicted naringenin-chalcone synthase
MPERAFINRIGCAVPEHDVHSKFVDFAPRLLASERERRLFQRMAERSRIEHRYSCLAPGSAPDRIDDDGFYRNGAFPDTHRRMARYEQEALPLARRAVADLGMEPGGGGITHLIVASCTGFFAPGLDLQLIEHMGLSPTVERTVVGFMGCYAAVPALKLVRHIVRSEPAARVLVVALELCTLHLQEGGTLDEVLSFLIFGDGCAAALVSAEPIGIEIDGFAAAILPETADHITWRVGALGFDMHLSGRVPAAILHELPDRTSDLLSGAERQNVALWAVHPGGRTVLDAVEEGLGLAPDALTDSRRILRDFGNMSSASVLFVLRDMVKRGAAGLGCAMAFGPGIAVEAMTFSSPQ